MSLIVRFLNHAPSPVARMFGSRSLVSRLLRPLANRLLPEEPTAVVIRSGAAKGMSLFIHPGQEKFYWTGGHEKALQEALVKSLRTGMTVWDVGAHAGFFTLISSKHVGPEGRVHAFEPSAATRARLERSIEANRLTNVTVHAEALADEARAGILNRDTASSKASLVRGGQGGERVSLTTVDDLVERLGAPDLIKVDVEGAEAMLLRGAQRTLERHGPLIVIEFNHGEELEKAKALLHGYRLESLDDQHWLATPDA